MKASFPMLSRFLRIFSQPYFGFVQGHDYLTKIELDSIEVEIGKSDRLIVERYESDFSKLIGDGFCTSYAAARMGFYELMRIQGVGPGDEVILTGSTCSVMPIAVMRLGATPVYADINPDNFGSCAVSIKRCVSTRTKVIVAQHSFGIPCEISKIAELASALGIFLIEDCALSVGSSINGVRVGNFGDASIFSTDHSKPINTMSGGIVYTKSMKLHEELQKRSYTYPELTVARQKSLWTRFLIERKFCNPRLQGWLEWIDAFYSIFTLSGILKSPFLSDDFGTNFDCADYGYPAKMPAFLCKLGSIEINRWPSVARSREHLLSQLINAVTVPSSLIELPKCYSDKSLQIVPLRFVWSSNSGHEIRTAWASKVRVNSIWFLSPIISTKVKLSEFGYKTGQCPISERLGQGMLNLPCNLEASFFSRLIELARGLNK